MNALRTLLRTGCLLVASLGLAHQAAAQSCAGFTDVAAASAFCPNVEWMKNRGITIGCTSSTLYCPNDFVTRLSMAVFMNRLGKALTPELLYREEIPGVIAIPAAAAAPARICQSAVSTATAYPRSATIHAAISGLSNAASVSWRGGIAVSVNAGPWTLVPNSEFRASSGANAWSFTAPDSTVAVNANTTLQVALTVGRDDVIAGTTGDFANSRCQVVVEIENQNGSSSPFDESLAGATP
jgi:hypothetical protein